MKQGRRTLNLPTAAGIGGLLVVLMAWSAFWVTSPVNQSAEEKMALRISRGDSIDAIAQELKEKNLIRSKAAFKLLVVGKGLTKSIQAGEYELSQKMSLGQIAKSLTHGTSDLRVILIEGLRREEMADVLEEEFASRGLSFDKGEFLTATEGKEGYLFPDTYHIPTTMKPSEIAETLLKTQKKKVDPSLRTTIEKQGILMQEAIILASLIEREARFAKDRPLVAGILIKRWENQWPLQVDATIQYALGYQAQSGTWWKKSLTKSDIDRNSPYNTYKRIGLPPTPISNPSLVSIEAVANPQASEFWFYLSDTEGNLHYSKTIEEHNQNIKRYLGK